MKYERVIKQFVSRECYYNFLTSFIQHIYIYYSDIKSFKFRKGNYTGSLLVSENIEVNYL